ncbi:hypothetical protein G3O01_09975 [Burkholderia sp. Ac-20365]|nr:hypothetical protein [Burkholderia sp. Ac-20365]
MPSNIWNTFFDHFSQGLKSVCPNQFARDWNNVEARTDIYRSIIQSATAMPATPKLTFEKERCRIDFMLGNEVPTRHGLRPAFVPIIAIESENHVKDAAHEVNSLCALACPTKLLITCAIWARKPKAQLSREALLQHWRSIYIAHQGPRSGRQSDVFAIVVGERTRQELRFYLEFISSPIAGLPEPFHIVQLPVDEACPVR